MQRIGSSNNSNTPISILEVLGLNVG